MDDTVDEVRDEVADDMTDETIGGFSSGKTLLKVACSKTWERLSTDRAWIVTLHDWLVGISRVTPLKRVIDSPTLQEETALQITAGSDCTTVHNTVIFPMPGVTDTSCM